MCRPKSEKNIFFQRRIPVEFVEFLFLGQFSKSLITFEPGAK